MADSIILTSLNQDELQKLISEAVQQALMEQNKVSNTIPTEDNLLSRTEVQKLLKISGVTLWQRMCDGSLPFKKIGRKVLFSKQEIMDSIKTNSVRKKKSTSRKY